MMALFDRNRPIGLLRFWVWLTVGYSLIFTTIDFWGSPVSGAVGLVSLVAQAVTVALCTAGVLGLMVLNRIIFSLTFTPLLLLSTVLGYYKITMDVSFTPMLLDLVMVTDLKTDLTVLTPAVVVLTVGSAIAGVAITMIRWRRVEGWRITYRNHRRNLLLMLAGCVTLTVLPGYVRRINQPVMNRMPYVFYYATSLYVENLRCVADSRPAFDMVEVVAGIEPVDVVVVIGESLRADHLGINGYPRCTTPRLSLDTAVVSFPHIKSVHSFTHVSVPHILTRADSIHQEIAYEEPSFISLFKKAGYRTAWFANQDNLSTYVYFMHEADTLVYGNAVKNTYNFGSWYDSDMIPAIGDFFISDSSKPRLAVVHTIGSHWWYNSHYPDSLACFKPEADSRVISELSDEQLINSYDNTIVATDLFLAQLIDMIRQRNALLIYISDHGEALGENGVRLHASDCPQLHNPACMVWYSSLYAGLYPERVAALRANASHSYSTDIVFHSVLHGAGLQTAVADTTLSIFCYGR